jgi:hypothetical protein
MKRVLYKVKQLDGLYSDLQERVSHFQSKR